MSKSSKSKQTKKPTNWKKRYQNLLNRSRAPRGKSIIVGGAEVASLGHPLYRMLFESATPGAQPPLHWWIEAIKQDYKEIFNLEWVGKIIDNAIKQGMKKGMEIVVVQGVLYVYRRVFGRRRPKLVLPLRDLIGFNVGVKL